MGEEPRHLPHLPGSSATRLGGLYADFCMYVSKCHIWERFFHNVKKLFPPIAFNLKQIKYSFTSFALFPIFSFRA